MAQLARGRLRNKLPELEKALTGIVASHQRKLLALQLEHVDFLDEQVEELNADIRQHIEEMDHLPSSENRPPESGTTDETSTGAPLPPMSYGQALIVLDTAPGVNQNIAERILAELGADMRRFATPEQAAAWTGLAPGNNESGGKRCSGRIQKGNFALRTALVQAAWAAVRDKDTYLRALYNRVVVRRGKKRAIIAVAHSLLKSIWHMLAHHEPYRDLGADYFDQRNKESKVKYHLRQLEKLGCPVQI